MFSASHPSLEFLHKTTNQSIDSSCFDCRVKENLSSLLLKKVVGNSKTCTSAMSVVDWYIPQNSLGVSWTNHWVTWSLATCIEGSYATELHANIMTCYSVPHGVDTVTMVLSYEVLPKMFTSSFNWRVSFLILSTLLCLHTNDIQADCEHSTQWHMYCMTHSLFLNAFLMCGYYRFIFLLNSCTELSWKWSRSLCEFELDRDKHFLDLSALHKEPEIFRFIDPVVCESRCLEYCR